MESTLVAPLSHISDMGSRMRGYVQWCIITMVVITIITISLVVELLVSPLLFLLLPVPLLSYFPSRQILSSLGKHRDGIQCVMEVIDENMRTACPKTLQATSCNDPEPNLDVHRQLQGVQKYLHQGSRKV